MKLIRFAIYRNCCIAGGLNCVTVSSDLEDIDLVVGHNVEQERCLQDFGGFT